MAAIVRGYVSCRFRALTKPANGWWFLAPPGLEVAQGVLGYAVDADLEMEVGAG